MVRKLTVHILDKKRGIALFEQTNTSHAGIRWTLMIAADKIKSVPIIVNHCPTQKLSELEFDEVDVSKLLEMK